MLTIYLKEQEVKAQMINEILNHKNIIQNKSVLQSKTLSEIKFIYYECK